MVRPHFVFIVFVVHHARMGRTDPDKKKLELGPPRLGRLIPLSVPPGTLYIVVFASKRCALSWLASPLRGLDYTV
jgi:hypothetical protein